MPKRTFNLSLSPSQQRTARELALHEAALSYTLSNAGLYFITAHLFPENIALTDHPTTHPTSSAEIVYFAIIAACTLNLVISSHRSLYKTCEKVYCRFTHNSTPPGKLKVGLDVANGLYKASVSLSSLFTLIYKVSAHTHSQQTAYDVASIISSLFIPGCAVSNTAILLEPFAKSLGCIQSPGLARWLARIFAFFYAVPNASLYFYNLLMAPMRLGYLSQPLYGFALSLDRPALLSVFWLSAILCLHFMWETYRTWVDKNESILLSKADDTSEEVPGQIQNAQPDQHENPFSWRERLHPSGVIAGTVKALITALGLIVASKVYDMEEVGAPVALLLLLFSHMAVQWALFTPSDATLTQQRRAREQAEERTNDAEQGHAAVPLLG